MGKVKIVLNSAGIREMLKSSEIAAICEAEAKRMTQATGVAYHSNVYLGRTRVNATGVQKGTRGVKKSGYSGKRKSKGAWVTVNGQKMYIKGYSRKKGKKK